jgi:hypothetical protein
MCEFCDVKMMDIGTKEGWLDMVWNHNLIKVFGGDGGKDTLFVNRDEKGVYIFGSGECDCDIYYPKYCPECGRKLKGEEE